MDKVTNLPVGGISLGVMGLGALASSGLAAAAMWYLLIDPIAVAQLTEAGNSSLTRILTGILVEAVRTLMS